jgi:hypothetical protein
MILTRNRALPQKQSDRIGRRRTTIGKLTAASSKQFGSIALIVVLGMLVGCAAGGVSTKNTTGLAAFANLASKQHAALSSYATLLRVKMWHEGRVDDFRAEVFSRSDSLISIYVRGFLGKSAFKAVLVEDSLLVYFPSEHKYFSGLRRDLETGELRDSRYVIDYLLALLHGYAAVPDSADWEYRVVDRGTRSVLMMSDRQKRVELRVEVAGAGDGFPFQNLENFDLRSTSGKVRISVQAQSSHYNRDIPVEKYVIDLPTSAVRLTKDELVELLTGVAP